MSWLMAAVAVTVLFGPTLGLRGWAWLLAHHVICLVGSLHELRRVRQRAQR